MAHPNFIDYAFTKVLIYLKIMEYKIRERNLQGLTLLFQMSA